MDEIERKLLEGNPWELGDKGTLTYVGIEDYEEFGGKHYLFADIIEASGGPLPDNLCIFQMKEDLLSIEGGKVINRSGRYPQGTISVLDERYWSFVDKIRRSKNENQK